ncbi:MAG: TonB-dependent receptor [Spirochaetaceae bacterium]|jgi:iron complex outermembrane receptor protein|nr:TonB-dependent receptor [Spirochaetaceae bacterium]
MQETAESDETIVLPEAAVMAERETTEHISREQMRERNDSTLYDVLRWIPGVTPTGGHAGLELGGINVRGKSNRYGGDSLTVIVDGVPISNQHGGFGSKTDYASMLTEGIESIDLTKGYTSVLLGPNVSSGALMIRTAKPKKLLGLDGSVGIGFDGGGFANTTDAVTVSSRLDKFYVRAGVQERYVDHWRLPNSFEPKDTRPPEEGGDPQHKGNRIFSESNTLDANIMLGANPLDQLDIWATYAYFSKMQLPDGWTPTRAGNRTWSPNATDPDKQEVCQTTFMGFPYRNRHDAALHTVWDDEKFNAGIHGYFSLFDQRQLTLAQSSYATNLIWPQYKSDNYTIADLNSYTYGVNLEGAYNINDWSIIKGGIQFKKNDYNLYNGFSVREKPEHTDKYATRLLSDIIYFGGVEYTANFLEDFTAIMGIGLDMSQPVRMDRWNNDAARTPIKSDTGNFLAMPQWGLAFFYDIDEAKKHELHLTYAKKNRFPNFNEKESAVNPSITPNSRGELTKPNPDLGPEQTHTFEFGYRGYFFDRIRISSAIYTDYEIDKIASVTLKNDPLYTSQYQNINENIYYGVDFGTEMFLNDYLTMGGALGVNKYKILETNNRDANEVIQDSPQLTANGYFSIAPFGKKAFGLVQNIRLMPRFEYMGAKLESKAPDAIVGTSHDATDRYLGDYVLFHIGLSADIGEHFTAFLQINNLMDELYYRTAYMPEPGRSFNISVTAHY